MKGNENHELIRLKLQGELIRRCKENPRYSMRAFARSLRMDFSTLSKILQGRRKLGVRAITRIGTKLGLSPIEVAALTSTPDEYSQVANDEFEVISDWYHFAILELMRVKGFRSDTKWIAACLGITPLQAQAAKERLERIGMIKVQKNGKWKDVSSPKTTVITPGMTSAAQQNLQRQILEKSIAALVEVPIAERDHTAVTFALDPAKLTAAKQLIKKFRRNLSKFLSRGSPCSEVYHLNVSLYPVTRIHERK